MGLLTEELTVIGITHALGTDGKSLYQVAFGKLGPSAVGQLPAGTKIAAVWATVFIPADGPCPYQVGTKWQLSVDDDGSYRVESGSGGRESPARAPASEVRGA